MRRYGFEAAFVFAAFIGFAPVQAAIEPTAGADKGEVKAWADKTVDPAGWSYMGVVARSTAPFALYMTEGPASPDVKRAIWLRNEYMVEVNGYRSLQALLDIDCGQMKVRIKKSIAFKDNNLKTRISVDEAPSAWQPAQPGSVLSGVVGDTCKSPPRPQIAAATTGPSGSALGAAGPPPAAGAQEASVPSGGDVAPQAVPVSTDASSPPGSWRTAQEAPPRAHPVLDGAPVASPRSAPPGDAGPPGSAATPDAPPATAVVTGRPALRAGRTALSAPNLVGRARAAARSAPADGPRLQLGAFAARDQAEKAGRRILVESAALRGLQTSVEEFRGAGVPVFRLLVGPFSGPSEATAACSALRARGQACFLRR